MSDNADQGPTTGKRSLGAVLEADHHRIDAHFARFAAALAEGRVDGSAFAEASAGLRHHIYVEETLHFPALKKAGVFGPIMVMLREHGELWNLLVTIESAIAEDQPAPKIAGSWQQLETTLTEHNFKEERILYPAGDEALTDDESGQVRSELAEGVLPQGWVCQMAAGS